MSNLPRPSFADTLLVRDHCLCLHAQRAARALARRYDAALRPFGITSGQFSLMMALNRPDPPAMAPVAALLAIDRTTLTAALKPLARRGFVNVTVDPADRRGRRLVLTSAGHALLGQALPAWEQTHAALEALVADAAVLRSELRALSSLAEGPGEAGSGRCPEPRQGPVAPGPAILRS